ncbi:hypothetical protein ABZX95_06205 [Streptomyces sp. NPDC004232]|uniref:hypothetical protein n=1 Tax=Streptomyces sp. NPDC004232 TaxID=3154454 RepID=UPI0033AFE085
MSVESTPIVELVNRLVGDVTSDAQFTEPAKRLIQQIIGSPEVTEVLAPALLRGEAIRLQLQAAELLDEADRVELKAQLREAAKATDAPLEAALQLEVQLVEAVEEAIQAERQAEDVAREAAENQRLAVEAERDGQHRQLSASEQTDLLMRARAAADVAARLQAAAEGAKAHRESVEQQLVAARQLVRGQEAAEETAYALWHNPPKAPTSAYTALLDGFRRLMWGQQLDKQATAVVTGLVQDAAKLTGVTGWTRAAAIEQHDRELANRAFERNMPAPGHPLRPSNPASPVFAVRPPTG